MARATPSHTGGGCCLCLMLLLAAEVLAVPGPGDVFREYRWFHAQGDAGQAIRVGGKQGQEHPDRGWAHDYINASFTWPFVVDLEEAVRAEVILEKVLCHDGTTGLAIQVNDSDWFYVPEAPGIPAPQAAYQHHSFPELRIPLTALHPGSGNRFRLRVDPQHPWKWPQNLINGVHLRITYDPTRKRHLEGTVAAPRADSRLGNRVALEVVGADDPRLVRVDWVGLYEDVNLEGDGVYRRWHYLYDHGRLVHHVGSATQPPYRCLWDMTWLPDQHEPMQLAARLIDRTGLTFQTPPATGLTLARTGHVELCRPYDVPARWVTRSGEHTEAFDVRGDLSRARAAQLVWSSWSPGYMRGLRINGRTVFDHEGPHYQSFRHRVTLTDLAVLRPGRNRLTTGQTPPVDGHPVHGMEVNWPGIMVLVRYGP